MFSQILKELRIESNVSQKQLAQVIGYDQATISKYELDKCIPTSDVVVSLAKFFNVSTDYLLGLEDDFGTKTYSPTIKLHTQKELSEIQKAYDNLNPFNQGKVLGIAEQLLEEQKKRTIKV